MSWHETRLVAAVVAVSLLVAGTGCSSPDGGSSPAEPRGASAGERSEGGDGSGDTASAALYTAACAEGLVVGPGIDLPEELGEISGIAPSSTRSDVVWAVGDGGSAAAVYAVDLAGNVLATVQVSGVDNNDWEDLAAGPGLDGSGDTWLYVADIGDNTSERERIRIQAFPEPEIADSTVTPRSVLARYATGATDAEALSVTDEGIWILGKDWGGGPSSLYHLGFDAIAATTGDQLAVVEEVGVELDTDGDPVTAMDAAPARGVTAVRTYGKVRVFDQRSGDLAEVLGSEPCDGPRIVEGQGESIAVTADGRSIVTASEGGTSRPAELHVSTIG